MFYNLVIFILVSRETEFRRKLISNRSIFLCLPVWLIIIYSIYFTIANDVNDLHMNQDFVAPERNEEARPPISLGTLLFPAQYTWIFGVQCT